MRRWKGKTSADRMSIAAVSPSSATNPRHSALLTLCVCVCVCVCVCACV